MSSRKDISQTELNVLLCYIVYPLCSPPVGAVISALNYEQFQSEEPKQRRVFCVLADRSSNDRLEVEKTNLASRQKSSMW